MCLWFKKYLERESTMAASLCNLGEAVHETYPNVQSLRDGQSSLGLYSLWHLINTDFVILKNYRING